MDLTRDRKTQLTQAEAHFGLWRATNLKTWNNSVREAPTLGEGSTLGRMQQMLHLAYERKKMEDNIRERTIRDMESKLKRSGTILQDEEIANTFPVMSVVVLKIDATRSKQDKRPPNIGPFFVISHCKQKRETNLMELRTGKILRRSYRNLRVMVPTAKLLGTMAFPKWLDQHPLTIFHNDTIRTTANSVSEAAEDYKVALKHIAELYTFLAPVLPTVSESRRTIELYKREGEEMEEGVEELEREEEEQEEEQEKEQKEAEEEPEDAEDQDRGRVTFDMSHLTEEEQKEEEEKIEADPSIEIPRENFHTPEIGTNQPQE